MSALEACHVVGVERMHIAALQYQLLPRLELVSIDVLYETCPLLANAC